MYKNTRKTNNDTTNHKTHPHTHKPKYKPAVPILLVRTVHVMNADNCAQLLYTVEHRTDLIIFPFIIQTVIAAKVLCIGQDRNEGQVRHSESLSSSIVVDQGSEDGTHYSPSQDSYVLSHPPDSCHCSYVIYYRGGMKQLASDDVHMSGTECYTAALLHDIA